MDELTIEGKLYISSKRAAKVSGYAKDYIGQLCREGRVDSKLVGRSWYVYEPSIREHRFNDERSKAKKKGMSAEMAPEDTGEPAETPVLQKTWEQPTYTPEVVELLPEVTPQAVAAGEMPEEHLKTTSEMQSAWQEWFAGRVTTAASTPREEAPIAPAPPLEEERSAPTPEPIAVRMIVSDIAPKRERYEERPVMRQQEAPVMSAYAQPISRRKSRKSSIIAKAGFIGLIVISGSIALVATGLIEELHLGSFTDSPFLRYFQGSDVVEK